MRMITLCLSALIITVTSFAGNAKDVESFRDIKWGTTIDDIKNQRSVLEADEDFNDPNAYVFLEEDYNIGTVTMDAIYYSFNEDNKFYKVTCMGARNQIPDMLFILKTKFGEPNTRADMDTGKFREWTLNQVKFQLNNDYNSEFFTLTIISDWAEMEKFKINSSVSDF